MPSSGSVTKYVVPSGDNPPDVNSVPAGTLWFDNTNGQLYVLYQDADSLQWVNFSSAMAPDGT